MIKLSSTIICVLALLGYGFAIEEAYSAELRDDLELDREIEYEQEVEYEQEAEFNTTFIFGSDNGVDLKEVLKPLTGIYAVQLNNESLGSYYLVEESGKLMLPTELTAKFALRVKSKLLDELSKGVTPGYSGSLYNVQMSKRGGLLSLWANERYLVESAETNLPFNTGLPALRMMYNAKVVGYNRDGDVEHTAPFNGKLMWTFGDDYLINASMYSSDLFDESVKFDQFSLSKVLPGLESELTAGQLNLNGQYIEGFAFKGASLKSVDGLKSRQQRYYTPHINGVANTNATVYVYQGERLLQTKSVAAGPFTIDNLSGLSNQRLRIVVQEQDGTEQISYFENTFVPGLLTPDAYDYQINLGMYEPRSGVKDIDAYFLQADYAQGFTWGTPSVGALIAEDYASTTIGSAFSLGQFGALGANISSSLFQSDESGSELGHSVSVTYSKYVNQMANLQLAGYRYSTENYFSFSEAMEHKAYNNYRGQKIKNRYLASFTTRLPYLDNSLSLSFNSDEYWHSSERTTNYTLGYGGDLWGMNYSISASRTFNPSGRANTNIFLSINMLLSDVFDKGSGTASARYDSNGSQENVGVGFSRSFDRLSYSASATHQLGSEQQNISASAFYTGRYAQSYLSGFYSPDMNSWSGGLSGTIVNDGESFVLGANMARTQALVKVTGALGDDVEINGVTVDGNGKAIVPLNGNFQPQSLTFMPAAGAQAQGKGRIELSQQTARLRPLSARLSGVELEANRILYLKATLYGQNQETLGFGSHFEYEGAEYYVGAYGDIFLPIKLIDIDSHSVVSFSNNSCHYKFTFKPEVEDFLAGFVDAGELLCVVN
ncbi:fimbria/pilus outer membrane usher protein [Shewanella fidelis]|uniref:fimbria/pilus outer membrane usher protein n=1 Tax=Shewanella fidelis TaxID=173509 RepID=UPI0004BAE454|nr:fimbria/pilus outer membrane usher protein [Shewanella fidelis]